MGSSGVTEEDTGPAEQRQPDWRRSGAWVGFTGVGLALGLVLGGVNALGAWLLEDFLELPPHLAAMEDLAVIACLFGLSLALIRTLDDPLGSFEDPEITPQKWWRRQQLTLGRFPAGPGSSFAYMGAVFAAAGVAYLAACHLLVRESLWLILFMQALVAVYAALYAPLKLLRKLSGEPGDA